MKTAISIPDPIFEEAEEAAKELRMSRSELYTIALREFLQEKQTAHITERLNRVYEEASSTPDPVLVRLQAASLPVEEW
jgi:metal-responsive CopG/Arc/MetJ family transcriptional regulator